MDDAQQCVDHPKCREELIRRINLRMASKTFLAGLTIVVVVFGIILTVWFKSYSSAEIAQTVAIKSNHTAANQIQNDVTIIRTKQEYLHDRMRKLGIKMDGIVEVQQRSYKN